MVDRWDLVLLGACPVAETPASAAAQDAASAVAAAALSQHTGILSIPALEFSCERVYSDHLVHNLLPYVTKPYSVSKITYCEEGAGRLPDPDMIGGTNGVANAAELS